MAFKAKDLEYDKHEPAFLRRMRGEYGGLDGRHNVQIARPKKDRLKTGDDDDDPVIVDEQGELVEKSEFERRQKQGEDHDQQTGPEEVKNDDEAPGKEQPSDRQKVTEIGGMKKRKAVRVVGAEDDDGDKVVSAIGKEETNGEVKVAKKKDAGAAKKKGKKIKLSFDEPE
ncbi:hypothetical protein EDD37DRAFT_613332 [Exophiala viscosa]|uniref:DUF4604 domain-containing protein n=1 Tax=Exophiala viscosa TaxID=2486360 RepID=A0AAN6I866_9EURO|nr:hypothetical protein EDD36DRAFT_469595 [Exophiala viscosa]KAI1620073.1 hypothetical protein EDD37DRAFT_613332 [Exophiala viscosa]